MSKRDSKFQEKIMSFLFKGKGIFKPLNTGHIDENLSCVREYAANVFFYKKNGKVLMIDAGYNYSRLAEKMSWIDLKVENIKNILLTHQDTDHVGAVEEDGQGLFRKSKVYIGEIENEYLTGKKVRKVYWGFHKLPGAKITNEKVLIKDGDIFYIDDVKVEAILVPGHTWGHLVYILDDKYVFTGDTLWLGADGGYSFINVLAEDNNLSKKSLLNLKNILKSRKRKFYIITGHTGWCDDIDFAFANIDKSCSGFRKAAHVDLNAPYDAYDESDDTEESSRNVRLEKINTDQNIGINYKNWMPANIVKAFKYASIISAFGMTVAFKKKKRNLSRFLGVTTLFMAAITADAIYTKNQLNLDNKNSLARQILEYVADKVEVRDDDKILDVGCGSGAFGILVAKKNLKSHLTGTDNFSNGYKDFFSEDVWKNNIKFEGIKNAEFVYADARKLPMKDESYDIVISNYVYHNIPGNKKKMIMESLRCLKKGGRFVIHDDFLKIIYGDINKIIDELKENGYEKVCFERTDNGYPISCAKARAMGLKGSAILYGVK